MTLCQVCRRDFPNLTTWLCKDCAEEEKRKMIGPNPLEGCNLCGGNGVRYKLQVADRVYLACADCTNLLGRWIVDRKQADCCGAWALSAMEDTEDHGGPLRHKSLDNVGWMMGHRLPKLAFCPWCGAKK